MRQTITAPFRRVMRPAASPDSVHAVHFHVDRAGRGYVCDHHRCESPRLSARELELAG